MYSEKKHKYIIFAILIIIIFNSATVLLYTRFAYNFGADGGFPKPINIAIKSNFYIFQKNNYSGLINPYSSSSIYLLFQTLFLLFSPLGLSGLKYAGISNILFISIIGSLSTFFLIYALLDNFDNYKAKILFSGIGGILFTSSFNYFSSINITAYLLPTTILFFYLVTKAGINDNKLLYIYLSLGTIALSLSLSFLGTGSILQGFITVLIIILFGIVASRDKLIKNLKYYAIMISLSFLIISPLILFAILSSKLLSNQIVSISATSNFSSNQIVNIIFNIVPFSFNLYPNFLYLISLIFVIFSVTSVLLYVKKTKDNTSKFFILGFILALIVLFALGSAFNKPFGQIFIQVYKILPYFIAFRAYVNYAPELFFLFTVILSIGSFYIFYFKKNDNRIKTFVLVFMLIFLFIFLYFNTYLPIITNGMLWSIHLFPFIKSVPSYTTEIATYINSNNNGFSISTLPSDDDWHLSKWYDAPDIYSSLLNAPVYTGGFTSYNEFFFPQSQDQYGTIARYIEEDNYSGIGVLYALGSLGIKYIIIQGNTSNVTFGPNHPLIPYNFSKIYSNLNGSGATLVKRYASSSIYLNKFAVPLVYPTNIYQTKVNNSINIIKLIKNESINPLNFSIYSGSVSGPILWYGNVELFNSTKTVNATPIANFTKPDIKFTEDNPTQATVNVSNAITPYYLIFRETYDPHWAAFYSNGTEVNPRNHIAVNGFANAWYMNKTGNYTITLYYTLQTDAWIAWGVSFAALFATISIGVYGWKEIAKAKMRRRG